MERDSHSPPQPSSYLPVQQLSNRGRSLSPDRYSRQHVLPPITETTIRPACKHIPSLAKTDSVLTECERQPGHSWSHLALTRHSNRDSILFPPPVRSKSQAEFSSRSCSQLPSSYLTSPNVCNTCDVPNRRHLSSASEKTRPALPRMHLVKALSIDVSTLQNSSFTELTDPSLNNEPTSQFQSAPDGNKCSTPGGTHSDSIQTTETDTCIPSIKYDPNCPVNEKLLPLLALIVGEKLSCLTENLGLSASVREQAKETYSLPDTQALYVLRVWVDQKEQKMSDLLDALDRTGLKEVVVWAKAGRLEEFLHMQQERRKHRQAKWVSRFSTSVKPASSVSFVIEHGVDNIGMHSRESGMPLSQQALQEHDVAMSSTTSRELSTFDDQPIRSGNIPLLATSPSLTNTLSDLNTDEGYD